MTRYYIAWNADKSEGFITDSREDRDSAISGEPNRALGFPSMSTLGERFSELYGDEDPVMSEVDIEDDSA